MKKSILIIILLYSYSIIFAQKKQTYLVEYLAEQKKVSTSLPDSVKERKIPIIVYTINNGDTTGTDTIESTTGDLVGSSNFAVTFYTLANKDTSKTFYTLGNKSHSESGGNISFTANIAVDTIFYDRKKWYEMRKGSTKDMNPYYAKISFTKTSETKEILGYKCIKFVSSGKDRDKNISFWASKDLPATLIPYAGLKSFGYGILQVDDPKMTSFTKATKITKL